MLTVPLEHPHLIKKHVDEVFAAFIYGDQMHV